MNRRKITLARVTPLLIVVLVKKLPVIFTFVLSVQSYHMQNIYLLHSNTHVIPIKIDSKLNVKADCHTEQIHVPLFVKNIPLV